MRAWPTPPVYVLETRPTDSAYERIVFWFDQESCLPLLVRFCEPGKDKPRKELTTDPRSNLKHGERWVAHSALMRDLENLTTTHLMVDSHAQEPADSRRSLPRGGSGARGARGREGALRPRGRARRLTDHGAGGPSSTSTACSPPSCAIGHTAAPSTGASEKPSRRTATTRSHEPPALRTRIA